MTGKQKTSNQNTDELTQKTVSDGVPPPDVAAVLERVQSQLQAGLARQALETIQRSRLSSPWLVNASAVSHMRLGEMERAVHLLRGLVVTNGIFGKSTAPVLFQTNFATALLLSDNLPGCLATLAEIGDEQHPLVQQLRSEIQQWKRGLSFWQRLNLKLGGQPACKPEIAAPGHVTA